MARKYQPIETHRLYAINHQNFSRRDRDGRAALPRRRDRDQRLRHLKTSKFETRTSNL